MTDPTCPRCHGTGDMNHGGTSLDPPAPCDICTMPLHISDSVNDWLVGTCARAIYKDQISEKSARETLHDAGISTGRDTMVYDEGDHWLWIAYDTPTRYNAVTSDGQMLDVDTSLYRRIADVIAARENAKRRAAA